MAHFWAKKGVILDPKNGHFQPKKTVQKKLFPLYNFSKSGVPKNDPTPKITFFTCFFGVFSGQK